MKQVALEDMVRVVIGVFLESNLAEDFGFRQMLSEHSGLLRWDDVRYWFSHISDEAQFEMAGKLIDMIRREGQSTSKEGRKNRRFKKILRRLDDSGFQPLKGSDSKKVGQIYNNLWGMFGLTEEVRIGKIAALEARQVPNNKWPSVSDYAWTEDVKKAFYNHPFHKRFIIKVKKMNGTTWESFVLNAEPATYENVKKT